MGQLYGTAVNAIVDFRKNSLFVLEISWRENKDGF
jgi:hypothetical protein